MNELSLVPIDPTLGGYDWAIDGQPLGKWGRQWTREMPQPRRDGVLPTHCEEDLTRLQGVEPPPPALRKLGSGRIPLYTCSQCGDLGCGAFCVRVTLDGDSIMWSDFAWQNDRDAHIAQDEDFADVPMLRFDRAYLRLIQQAITKDP